MRGSLLFCASASALAGCSSIDLNALQPNAGPVRSLVEVDGDTFLTSAYWDAGAPTEQRLDGNFLGSAIFTVPSAAALGPHNVELRSGSVSSSPQTFTVTQAQPWTAPRVDRVSLAYADFTGAQVTTWLYVQAANGDVNAEVLVNGVIQPTIAHRGLRNNLFGVNPQDLNFPIHHWVSYIVPWEGATGSTIQVSVRNSDNQTSAPSAYQLPTSALTLDSDGDDIPDVWEINGYDWNNDGTIDIDLAALGADPLRPDIFVEADIMQSLNNAPTAAVWTNIEAVFADAPFINPGGAHGIHIEIDRSGTVPFFNTIGFNATPNTAIGREDFYTLKGTNFNNNLRGRIYHYAIWANAHTSGWSGESDVDFPSNNGGDDFIVSFDDFPADTQTVKSMVETFVHELGHNLRLRHGGTDHAPMRPNHNSVMSYSWQLRTSTCCGLSNAQRQRDPVYSPFYYQRAGSHEINGAVPGLFSNQTDYSTGMARSLNETCLDETVGLYDTRNVRWNTDADNTDTCVSTRDLNANGSTSDTINDFSSWANITFVGPRTNGRFGG